MGEGFVSDDEFHETFEDITSTSGSESAEEEGSGGGTDRVPLRVTKADPPPVVVEDAPVWTSSSFRSKFSVWKEDPSSINERRQRFFKQMGLRSSRDESLNGSPLSGHGGAGSKSDRNVGEEEASSASEFVKPSCGNCGGTLKNCAHLDPENAGTDVQLASKLAESGCKSNLDNGAVQVHRSGDENFPDKCSTVSGEGESEPGLKSAKCSKSPDQKPCDCAESFGRDCMQESFGNGAEFQDSLIKKPDSESSSSLDDGSGLQHRASSSQEKLFQSFDTDLGSECGSPQSAIEKIMEERLKIRDLDSGKEFLMKRFNRDGSLNMLREVATGKDLTLAEFEKTLGLFSPVTQELHRRERFGDKPEPKTDSKPPTFTKRKSWLKKLKGALKTTSSKDRSGSLRSVRTFDTSSQRSIDDTDTSSQMGSLSGDGSPKRDSSFAGLDRNEFTRRGSLPTEDSDGSFWRKPQKVKVKLRQKGSRELSDLHLSQEIVAHQGAIWTMKFSPDGRFLASAGQDRVVHVWEVVDHPLMTESDLWKGSEKSDGDLGQRAGSIQVPSDGSVKAGQDRSLTKIDKERSTKSGKGSQPRKLKSSNHSKGPVPKLFWLSEKPMCSFWGHTEDILDLSWSRSQFLLSSSMDKTVRLWHISYDECLRVFSHNDYVTCAQFNPLDDRYFLSGSLDDRVRIWSIPEHHVVDWNDLQEMVTAVCYTPDGKKAIVGSYKGTCRFYNATGNKLQLDAHIDVREESKKARGKKITGLHCMPGDPQKVLVTSNDSRVRVYDGLNLVAKYKGLRNVKSQISSSFSPTGDFIISASEDSRVLVWNSCNKVISNKTSLYRRDKQLSCEEFTARHVSVAIAWPGSSTPPITISDSSRYEPLGKSSEDFQVLPNESLESSPPMEENVILSSTTKGSDENSKCPSYCLGRSPLGIFGSGRKNSVAVADELTSTKQQQVEGGKQQHGHLQLDAASSPIDIISTNKVSAVQSPVPLTVQSLDACETSPPHRRSSFFPECGPKGSAITWPEEKLGSFRSSSLPNLAQSTSICSNGSPAQSGEMGSMNNTSSPVVDVVSSSVSAAWGLVIVTAGLGGEITTFQNYGFPVRL